ncbi:hypothetical protein HS121_17610 [bacterium]|nr:hypothetical protein [bacterium]
MKEEVTMEGMLFSFDLWSRYGWYHPQSLDMLKIRLAEIRALDALTAMKQDPLFLEGVWDQAKGTGESTINAVKHPFKTVANIPLGLHKFGKQVHARTLEGDTLPDDEVRFIHEKAKRGLAVSLGVDPYSDNRPLRKLSTKSRPIKPWSLGDTNRHSIHSSCWACPGCSPAEQRSSGKACQPVRIGTQVETRKI